MVVIGPIRPPVAARRTGVSRETREGIVLQALPSGVGELTVRVADPVREYQPAAPSPVAAPPPSPTPRRPAPPEMTLFQQRQLLQSVASVRQWEKAVVMAAIVSMVIIAAGFAFWYGLFVNEVTSAD